MTLTREQADSVAAIALGDAFDVPGAMARFAIRNPDVFIAMRAFGNMGLELREALGKPEAWEANTYQLGMHDRFPYIRCLRCMKRSFNRYDITHRFCGHCYTLHKGEP